MNGFNDTKSGTRGSSDAPMDELKFTLNGNPIVLRNVDPHMMLIDYLRSSQVGLSGTKLSCGEGGCGACTVVLTRREPESGEVRDRPINACLRPLCSVDGMAITTVERIGDHLRMNPIQERIVSYNGSQCGFCTPGFVTCMFAMLRSNSSPSKEEVEGFFDGNLCRCTGFRPILDAMQSLVGDAAAIRKAIEIDLQGDKLGPLREFDISDGISCWRRVTSVPRALSAMKDPDGRSVKLVNGNTSIGIYKRSADNVDIFLDISQIEELKKLSIEEDGSSLIIGSGVSYAALLDMLDGTIPKLAPGSARVLQLLRGHVLRIAGHQVRSMGTVGGNIMLVLGQAESEQPFPSDLFTVLATLDATVSLLRPGTPGQEQTYPILELPKASKFSEGCLLTTIRVPLDAGRDFVEIYKVARRPQNSHAIVNAGFVINRDDDHRVTGCRIVFGGIRPVAWRAKRTEEVFVGQVLDHDLLARAFALLSDEVNETQIAEFGDGISASYRCALAVNLLYKFVVQIGLCDGSVDDRLADAGRTTVRSLSFGRHGTIAAPYVPGAKDRLSFLRASISLLKGTEAELSIFSSSDVTTPPGFAPRREESVAKRLAEALGEGDTSNIAPLVPLPMAKLGAGLQATGEAKYTQDISLPREPLACQFVTSQRSFAKFGYSDTIPNLLERLKREFPGVSYYVSYEDVPVHSRTQTYDAADPGNYDPVFANVYVTAVGQPIGLILANAAHIAQAAARRMEQFITYDSEGLKPPVLTIDDALNNKSFLLDRSSLTNITRPGSDTTWLDDPDPKPESGSVVFSGVQETGAQAHFYFETQSVLAVPGEMDRMTIYCSSQNVGSCQGQVANALGISTAKVEAKALRIGGGFGGKEVRAPFFAVAAAAAAWKARQPVRLALDRNTDMRMVGKRHAFRGHFTLFAKDDGKIEKIKFDFVANAGSSYDCTLPVTDLVLLSADSAYDVSTFRASRKACLTNTLTNTAMRSFGVIQCSLIVEEAVERLAHQLGMAPEAVREHNFYRDASVGDRPMTPYGQSLIDCRINQVWSDFKKVIEFDARAARVEEFNRTHRWRKRGISMIPIKYGISYTFKPSNESSADILVYANDGTVLVKHGGMEMGQGIHTKIARLAADALGIDVKYIDVAGTSTFDVANAPSTGASTGTDLNGGAVWQACVLLRQRLVDFCKTANPVPDWETQWQAKWPQIIKAANAERIQLSTQALYKSPELAALDKNGQLIRSPDNPDPRIFYYFTYSVGASEVEIDVLTGEHSIVRADVVYDSGKTINASLDYGQIEGGFVQGIGNVTTEELYYGHDGELLSDGTWNYKIPCSKTIPIEFNVYLLDYVPSADAKTPLDNYGIRSAKSTGEPPLVLASSVFFAIKHAILAARKDAGRSDWFELPSPATVERIQSACLVLPDALVMKEA